jgi:hypothetical protein
MEDLKNKIKDKKLLIIIICVAIIFLFGFGAFVYYKWTNSPQYNIKQAKKTLKKGDFKKFNKLVRLDLIIKNSISSSNNFSYEKSNYLQKEYIGLYKNLVNKLPKRLKNKKFKEKYRNNLSDPSLVGIILNSNFNFKDYLLGKELINIKQSNKTAKIRFKQYKDNPELILKLKKNKWVVVSANKIIDADKKLESLSSFDRSMDNLAIKTLKYDLEIMQIFYLQHNRFPKSKEELSNYMSEMGTSDSNLNFKYGVSEDNQSIILGKKLSLPFHEKLDSEGEIDVSTYGVDCADPVYCIKEN